MSDASYKTVNGTPLRPPKCPACTETLVYHIQDLAYRCEDPLCTWGGVIEYDEFVKEKPRPTHSGAEMKPPKCPVCTWVLVYDLPVFAYRCENPRCNWGGVISDEQFMKEKEKKKLWPTVSRAEATVSKVMDLLDEADVPVRGQLVDRITALLREYKNLSGMREAILGIEKHPH